MPKLPNIYPMPNGKFRASISCGFDKATGKRIRFFNSNFTSQKQALEWQRKMQSDYGNGGISIQGTITFEKFMNEYFIPDYKGSVSKKTFETAQSKLKRLERFNNYQLKDISAPIVKQWQNSMINENLSKNYIRTVFQLFTQVLDLGNRLGMIPKNVARDVGNLSKEKPKVDFWTVEEFGLFIGTFDKDNIYDLLYFTSFWFFFMIGIRLSEFQALQWSDVDWENGLIFVNKSMYYKNKKEWYLQDTKTSSSVRVISLDVDTVEHLKYWKSIQDKVCQDEKYIFTIEGYPLHKSTLSRQLKRHSSFVGVKSIRIHDLRHSHASLMLSLGMNDLEMQNRLGHADVATAMSTYARLRPNALKDLGKRLSGSVAVSSDRVYTSKFNGNQYVKNKKI